MRLSMVSVWQTEAELLDSIFITQDYIIVSLYGQGRNQKYILLDKGGNRLEERMRPYRVIGVLELEDEIITVVQLTRSGYDDRSTPGFRLIRLQDESLVDEKMGVNYICSAFAAQKSELALSGLQRVSFMAIDKAGKIEGQSGSIETPHSDVIVSLSYSLGNNCLLSVGADDYVFALDLFSGRFKKVGRLRDLRCACLLREDVFLGAGRTIYTLGADKKLVGLEGTIGLNSPVTAIGADGPYLLTGHWDGAIIKYEVISED